MNNRTEVNLPKSIRMTFYLLLVVLIFHILIQAKHFIAPFMIAAMFAYLLYPVALFLETKLRIPRIPATILTLLLFILFIVAIVSVIYYQTRELLSDFPAIKGQAMKNIDGIFEFIQQNVGITEESQKHWMKSSVANFLEESSNWAGKLVSSFSGVLGRAILVPVYIFLMLFYRDKLQEFFFRMSGEGKKEKVNSVLTQISQVTRKYAGGLFVVFLILAVINTTCLYFVGIKFWLMLGLIAAACNFIPYFGTALGYSFTFLYCLVTQDSPNVFLTIFIIYLIVQFSEHNILTPNIVGDNVKLNPFIIIVSLIGGAMVWGLAGMLLTVPLVAVFRIICENTPRLMPIAFLLGTEGAEKHAISWKNIVRIFQKKKMEG